MDSLLTAVAAEGLSLSDSLEWWFRYLAPDPRVSYRFINGLPESAFPVECAFHTASGPERTDVAGRTILSIIVSLIVRDEPLLPATAAAIIATIRPFADEHGVEFLGVGCRKFRIQREQTKWMTLQQAIWMLRHYADTNQGGPLDYVFGFSGPNLPALARALTDLGMTTRFYDPQNEDPPDLSDPPHPPILLARVNGDGSDEDITARHGQAVQAAANAQAEFKGMDLEGLDSA